MHSIQLTSFFASKRGYELIVISGEGVAEFFSKGDYHMQSLSLKKYSYKIECE